MLPTFARVRDNRAASAGKLEVKRVELAALIDDMARWFVDCLSEFGMRWVWGKPPKPIGLTAS